MKTWTRRRRRRGCRGGSKVGVVDHPVAALPFGLIQRAVGGLIKLFPAHAVGRGDRDAKAGGNGDGIILMQGRLRLNAQAQSFATARA